MEALQIHRDGGDAVVSGFQSPLEREALPLLLRGKNPLLVVAATALEHFRPPAAWTAAIAAGPDARALGLHPGRPRQRPQPRATPPAATASSSPSPASASSRMPPQVPLSELISRERTPVCLNERIRSCYVHSKACTDVPPMGFPIPFPDRLPVQIEPCPIVESMFEIRFAPSEPWATLPGLLYARVRERYREQKALPLAELPEEMRRHDAALAHLPLHQFIGPDFLIQLGPRVVGLATRPDAYPGWPRVEEELRWLLPHIEAAGFVGEGERLGVRYINFFAHDIFRDLHLDLTLAGKSLGDAERQVSTLLKHESMTIRLAVTNSAVVQQRDGVRRGSVLDVDAWFAAPDFDLFTNGIERFSAAHLAIKQLFFGLLREENLRSLHPRYA